MRRINVALFILLIALFTVTPAVAQHMTRQDSLLAENIKELRSKPNAKAMEQFYLKIKEEFPMHISDRRKSVFDYIHSLIAVSWLMEGNLESYELFRGKIGNIDRLNSMVRKVIAGLVQEDKNLEMIAPIAREQLEIIQRQQGEGDDNMYQSWHYASFLQDYAMIQLKLGHNEQALDYISEADSLLPQKSPDFLNRYALILLANGKHRQALDVTTSAVKDGEYNDAIITTLKDAYDEVHNGIEGYDQYMASLQNNAYDIAYEEVKKKAVGAKPAPEWTLTNMEGEKVSLSDLRGSIIVIDFWATWCGPCKAAFPGLQKAVDEYKNDQKVKFFFIDVGQSRETVKSFMDKSNYTFNVLLDKDSKVKESYDNTTGIPIKFIIGPEGNIRFKSVGYSGSDSSEYNQTKAMIERVKEELAASGK